MANIDNIQFYIDTYGDGDITEAFKNLGVSREIELDFADFLSKGGTPLSYKPKKGFDAIKYAAAKHIDTNSEVLSVLCKQGYPDIKQAIAEHRNTSPENLEILSKNSNEWTRAIVAKNPNTSKKVRDILKTDGSMIVRNAVIEFEAINQI